MYQKQPWDAIQKNLNNWVDDIWGVGSSTHSGQIPVFSVSAVLVISHRHVQRPFPQGILCSITLAMDTNHHQVEGTIAFKVKKKSYFTTSIGLKRNSKDIAIYRFVVH